MGKYDWKEKCELTVYDKCYEIHVTYNYKYEDSQIEECHGFHEKGGGYVVDLLSVEVVICNISIDITNNLNEEQIQKIIDNLKIE